MADARREGSPYPKADLRLRGLARLVDLVLALAVANAARDAGPALAALYLLFADGLLQGQSIGKRLFGVRAMVLPARGGTRGRPAGYRESVLRNAPFALAGLFYGLSLVGWVLFFVVGVPLVVVEAWLVWRDRLGLRLGDLFADTQVVDGKVLSKAELARADTPLRTATAASPPGSATGSMRRPPSTVA